MRNNFRPFLDSVASKLVDEYAPDASGLTIVFPNKRSALFFKQYLNPKLTRPLFLPAITTISQLIEQISKQTRTDDLQQIAWLYQAFTDVLGSDESFADFYHWGLLLLDDFNDIDRHLVDADKLFTTIEEHKDLEAFLGDLLSPEQIVALRQVWANIVQTRTSEQKDKFMRIWRGLSAIYQQYEHISNKNGFGTSGQQHKLAAQAIKQWVDQQQNRHYWFVGFNNLSRSELKVVKALVESGKATMIWDFDQSLIEDNSWLEAGYFLKRYAKDEVFAPSVLAGGHDYWSETVPELTMTATSLQVGQAKYLTSLIKQKAAQVDDLSKIAVVLPDPSMLFSVLASLPECVDTLTGSQELVVNLSMGYPFRQTPLYSLLVHLIDCQSSAQAGKNGISYYHEHVLAILQHPYISSFFPKESRDLVQSISKQNLIRVPRVLFEDHPLGNALFADVTEAASVLDWLEQILKELIKLVAIRDKDRRSVQDEYFYQAAQQVVRFKEVISKTQIDLELKLFWLLLRRMLEQISLPFAGEPVIGLQVLGLLESRNLDFEHVIILSANEGVLPSSSKDHSFIPHNIRRLFGLPTHQDIEASSAYLFYRLLYRAKTVHLLYNAESTDNVKGEPTRFFYQLKYGLQWPISQQVLASQVQQAGTVPKEVPSTPEIREKIAAKFTTSGAQSKVLTPSAVTALLDCSLKFYLRQIAEVYEPLSVSEEADSNAIGQLLHLTMEWLYNRLKVQYGNHEIEPEAFEALKPFVSEAIDVALQAEKLGELHTATQGKLRIVTEVVKRYADRILELDQSYAPFRLESVEVNLDQSPWLLNVDSAGSTYTFKLGGKVDRVDIKEGSFRVVDYKTGKASLKVDGLDKVFALEGHKQEYSAIYQTLHYSMVYHQAGLTINPIRPALLSLRNAFGNQYSMESDPMILIGKQPVYDVVSQLGAEFESHLTSVLQTLMSPDFVFRQTSVQETCTYCAYKSLCQREGKKKA